MKLTVRRQLHPTPDQFHCGSAYKCIKYGVQGRSVDPDYTSQRRVVCEHIDKANRKTQDQFVCVKCGHFDHADVNATRNISLLAALR